MTDDPRHGLDERIDRVLRQQTTPRLDPAFRARVLARLDEPSDAWSAQTPWIRRMAVPAAAVAVCVVLALFVRIAPEPADSRATRGSGPPAAQAPASGSAVPPSRATSTEPDAAHRASVLPQAETANTIARGDGSVRPAAAPPLATGSDSTSGWKTGGGGRRADARISHATASALAWVPYAESGVSPSLSPIDVGGVSVDRIEVQPLASTAQSTLLGEPPPIEVEPVRVGAIGER